MPSWPSSQGAAAAAAEPALTGAVCRYGIRVALQYLPLLRPGYWSVHYARSDRTGVGINLYRFAANTASWIDPWGWACWNTERKNYWKDESKNNPGAYSPANLARMTDGKAPRMQVEVMKNGVRSTKDVSMELHHSAIPQRVGGPGVHSPSNLDKVTPWQHEAVDPYRNTGETLLRVIKDINIW